MKVKEFIEKLQQFDPELTVCLADWQEGYSNPSESAAEFIKLQNRTYLDKEYKYIAGSFLVIGDDGERDHA